MIIVENHDDDKLKESLRLLFGCKRRRGHLAPPIPEFVPDTVLEETAMSLQQPRSGLLPNQLCQSCVDNIFPDDNWEHTWIEEIKRWHSSYEVPEVIRGPFNINACLKASEAGCHFCRLMLECIREHIIYMGGLDPYRNQEQRCESFCSLFVEFHIRIHPARHFLQIFTRNETVRHFSPRGLVYQLCYHHKW